MYRNDFRRRLIAATPLICLFIYLVIGFSTDIWDKSVLIFLLIPIMPTLLGVKTIKVTFSLIVLVIYLVMGIVWDLWHPGWVIFLLIPIYHILFGRRTLVIRTKKNKKDDEIDMLD
ncbi:MAG: hypothetical protein WAP91_01585 [Bacilli bacterium]|jgi:hypothetical protein